MNRKHWQTFKFLPHPGTTKNFRIKLLTDTPTQHCIHGVYIEVDVSLNPNHLEMALNPNHLEMAVMDFDFVSEDVRSVSFNPKRGTVTSWTHYSGGTTLRDQIFHPLTASPGSGLRGFHGIMGLYLCAGGLAFFRRCADVENGRSSTDFPWETTGYTLDTSWAEGRPLTPFLVSGCSGGSGEGEVSVRINRVDKSPPLPIGRPSAEFLKRGSGGVSDLAVIGQEDA